MTKNAQAFKEANARSPVVNGAVISHIEGGAYYTLKNGKLFELTAAECRSVGPIRWDLGAQINRIERSARDDAQ